MIQMNLNLAPLLIEKYEKAIDSLLMTSGLNNAFLIKWSTSEIESLEILIFCGDRMEKELKTSLTQKEFEALTKNLRIIKDVMKQAKDKKLI